LPWFLFVLVAIVVVVVVMIIAVMMVVTIAPAVAVAIRAAVPTVVMIEAAVVSVPITGIILAAIVPRPNPAGSFIRRARPITFVPSVVVSDRIPITVDPNETVARRPRNHTHDAWRRRRPDADSNGNLGPGGYGTSQQ
jgi:hypothetical protein